MACNALRGVARAGSLWAQCRAAALLGSQSGVDQAAYTTEARDSQKIIESMKDRLTSLGQGGAMDLASQPLPCRPSEQPTPSRPRAHVVTHGPLLTL